ncbi:MAG: hypothetical protein U7126_31495 [Microcoleus sp.]
MQNLDFLLIYTNFGDRPFDFGIGQSCDDLNYPKSYNEDDVEA